MDTALANNYYLKALDHYPYDLTEFLEAINYALTYDEDHTDAHCLMGLFYMDQLQKFDDAKYHFNKALASDLDNLKAYYSLIRCLIATEEYAQAFRVIEHAQKVKGISSEALDHRIAIILERKLQFRSAKKFLKRAIEKSYFTSDREFYESELIRVKDKISKRKSKKNK